jgi:hypothetical protein
MMYLRLCFLGSLLDGIYKLPWADARQLFLFLAGRESASAIFSTQ